MTDSDQIVPAVFSVHFALAGVECAVRSTNHFLLALGTFDATLAVLRGLAVPKGSLNHVLAAGLLLHFAQ